MRCPFFVATWVGLVLALPGQRTPTGPERDAVQLEAAQRHRQRGEEAAAQALARAVLERQPDHQQARMFLGQQFFAGRWRLPEEVAYLRRAEGTAAEGTATAAPPPAAPAPPIPASAAPAIEPSASWRRPPRVCAPTAYGLLELRVQWVRSLGFETVPVSFGNGSGRLQLPRTESVSFGGAALVPLGTGR